MSSVYGRLVQSRVVRSVCMPQGIICACHGQHGDQGQTSALCRSRLRGRIYFIFGQSSGVLGRVRVTLACRSNVRSVDDTWSAFCAALWGLGVGCCILGQAKRKENFVLLVNIPILPFSEPQSLDLAPPTTVQDISTKAE